MAGQEVVLNVDQLAHAWQGRLTGGLSPSSLMLASLDWAVHLANSPGKQWQQATPVHQGSWWPAWQAWLQERSSEQVRPPGIGAPGSRFPPIADAPGCYVHEH